MKSPKNITFLVAFVAVLTTVSSGFAQATKADIFDTGKPLTWLGIDYSQAKFIGSEAAYKASGEVVNSEFTEKFIPAWNNLFIAEAKKYDVAKATHRATVTYAIDVAEKANNAIKKDFFDENPSDFKTLTEQNIGDLVKNYDFQGKTGLGLLFFMEGMSKGQKLAGMWVTFVDMGSKTVLLTVYETGASGGFGFRNYWAKPIYEVLKDMNSNFKNWKSK